MKKLIAIGAISLILAGCGPSASIDMNNISTNKTSTTTAPLKLKVDGQAVLPALSPFYSEDILYVPVRVLMEYYTAVLKWDNTAKTLMITNNGSNHVLKPDQAYIQADYGQHSLDGPARSEERRVGKECPV